MKKFKLVLLMCCLFFIGGMTTLATTENMTDKEMLADNIFVMDTEGVLSDQEKIDIYKLNKDILEPMKGMPQLLVYIIPSTYGDNIMDVATRVGREKGIGGKDSDMGMVLVFATQDRDYAFATGYGMEGVIPDSYKSYLVNDDVMSYWKNNEFNKGIMLFTYNVSQLLQGKLDIASIKEKEKEDERMVLLLMGLFSFGFIFMLGKTFLRYKKKNNALQMIKELSDNDFRDVSSDVLYDEFKHKWLFRTNKRYDLLKNRYFVLFEEELIAKGFSDLYVDIAKKNNKLNYKSLIDSVTQLKQIRIDYLNKLLGDMSYYLDDFKQDLDISKALKSLYSNDLNTIFDNEFIFGSALSLVDSDSLVSKQAIMSDWKESIIIDLQLTSNLFLKNCFKNHYSEQEQYVVKKLSQLNLDNVYLETEYDSMIAPIETLLKEYKKFDEAFIDGLTHKIETGISENKVHIRFKDLPITHTSFYFVLYKTNKKYNKLEKIMDKYLTDIYASFLENETYDTYKPYKIKDYSNYSESQFPISLFYAMSLEDAIAKKNTIETSYDTIMTSDISSYNDYQSSSSSDSSSGGGGDFGGGGFSGSF